MEEEKKKSTKKTTSGKTTAKKSTKTTTKKTTKKTTKDEVKTSVKKEVKPRVKKEVVKEEVKEVKEDVKESKPMSTETKRLLIVLGFVASLIIFTIIYATATYQTSAQIAKKVANLKKSNKVELVYLVKEGCQYCQINESNMKQMKDEFGIDYFEVDVAALGASDRDSVINTLELDPDNVSTPTLALVGNGQVLEVIKGVQAYNVLFGTLQQYGVIDESKNLNLNYIDYSGYKGILKSNEPHIVVLTSTTCTFCIAERPILDSIAATYGININWLYLNMAFSSQEEYDEFNSSLAWFEENPEWGTPTTLVIQNGQVISALSGYRTSDDIIAFYKQNGFIK